MWGKFFAFGLLVLLNTNAWAKKEGNVIPLTPRAVKCQADLTASQGGAYAGKTLILDANVIMHDEQVLNKFPGARIVIPAVLLEELDNNKTDLDVGKNVRAFVRQLMYLLKNGSGASPSEFKLDNGTTVFLDPRDYTASLDRLGFQKDKADNSGYLAPALFYKAQGANTILVTDDFLLTLKAVSAGVQTETFRSRQDLVPDVKVADGEMQQIEITDAQMQDLLSKNVLPKPEGVDIRPNEFVQFFSPSQPAADENVARYVYKRPVEIYDRGPLPPSVVRDGQFDVDRRPLFPDTLRVTLNGEEIPQIKEGEVDGWYYDTSTDRVVLLGKYKGMLYKESHLRAEAQMEPHQMERLKSFAQLGLWSLRARSLEQTMALNLMLDPTIDVVIQEGRAGTSKTFNFAVTAIKLKELGQISSVTLARPPAELGGHKQGFLPGDSDEKDMPWMEPFLDNVSAIDQAKTEFTGQKSTRKAGELPAGWSIQNYGRIRGRSLSNTLIGLDEFQNTRVNEAGTVLTRGSTGARYVLMGDVTQVDPPLTPTDNGLAYTIQLLTDPEMSPEQQSRVGYIRLKKSVRSPFAKMIGDLEDRQRAKRR